MSSQLEHLCLDDRVLWSDSSVGGCHLHLVILDLTLAGHQLMPSPCECWQLVFNGEIHNHNQFRGQLESASSPASCGHDDTERLLDALTIRGVSVTFPCLVGMFSFAL